MVRYGGRREAMAIAGRILKPINIYYYPQSPVGYSFVISAHDYNSKPSSFFLLGSDSIKISEGMVLNLTTGKNALDFDASQLSNGLYLIQLQNETGTAVQKMAVQH